MEDILRGDPRQWRNSVSAVVKVYIQASPDMQAELTALMTRATAELQQFAVDQGVVFHPVAMGFNVPPPIACDPHTLALAEQAAQSCLSTSCGLGLAVLTEDGDRGNPVLPVFVATDDFEALKEHLEPAALQAFERLYEQQGEAHYALRRIESVFPACADYTTDKQSKQAAELRELQALLAHDFIDKAEANLPLQDQLNFSNSVISRVVEPAEVGVGALLFKRTITDLAEHEADPGHAALFARQPNKSAVGADQWNQTAAKLESWKSFAYPTTWQGGEGIDPSSAAHKEYLDKLCADFVQEMKLSITSGAQAFSALTGDAMVMELQQHGFMCTKLSSNVHCREDFLRKLQRDVISNTRCPRVIHGSIGCGKSSIMAFASLNAAPANRGCMVIRFVEQGGVHSERMLLKSICEQLSLFYSRDYDSQLKQAKADAKAAAEQYNELEDDDDDLLQTIGLLKKRVAFMSGVHDTYRELVEEFKWRLSAAHTRRPVMIFIDGLDHLDNPDLSWIPDEMPQHVMLFASISEGTPAFERLQARLPAKCLVEIPELEMAEGGRILDIWLRDYAITVTDDQRGEIIDSFFGNPNPVHLKACLDLAELWESGTPKSAFQIGKVDTDKVIGVLFSQLEARHGSVIVAKILGYISSAKYGLSEPELLDLLSLDEAALDAIPWRLSARRFPPYLLAALRRDLKHCLVDTGVHQRLSWCHRKFGEVARSKYLSKGADWQAFHDYYCGTWLTVEKPFKTASGLVKKLKLPKSGKEVRYITPQPVAYAGGQFNVGRLINHPSVLTAARRSAELLSACLTNAEFVCAKSRALSLHEVVDDIEAALRAGAAPDGREALELLAAALHLAAPTVDEDGEQLFHQVLGRLPLSANTHPALLQLAADLRAQSATGDEPMVLVPVAACLQTPCAGQVDAIDSRCGAVHWAEVTRDGASLVAWTSVSPEFESHDALRVYDLRSGLLQRTFMLPNHLTVDDDDPDGGQLISLWCATMVADGTVLTTWANGCISVWDLASEAPQRDLEVQDNVTSVCVSDDMATLIAGCDLGVIVWDFASGKELRELRHGDKEVTDVCFYKGGQFLTACCDGLARMFGPTGDATVTYKGHARAVQCIRADPARGRVVTGGGDGTARVWNATSGEQLHVLDANGDVSCLAISASGRHVACGSGGDRSDRTVRLFALQSGAPEGVLTGHLKKLNHVAFTADEQRVVSAADDGTLRLWSVAGAGAEPAPVVHGGAVDSLCVAGPHALTSSAADPRALVWDTATGQLLHTIEAPRGFVVVQHGTALDGDGDSGAVAFTNSMVRVFACAAGTVLTEFVMGAAVTDVVLTFDGSKIVVALNNEVQVRDAGSGAVEHKFTVKPELAQPIQQLAMGPRDAFVCVTMVTDVYTLALSGTLLSSQRYGEGLDVEAACPCKDGKHILSCAADVEDVAFWSADRRKSADKVDELDLDGDASALASLSEALVLIGGNDGSVVIWNVVEQDMCFKAEEHAGGVDCLAVCPTSLDFASGSEDQTVLLWRASTSGAQSWQLTARFRTGAAVITLGLGANTLFCGLESGHVGVLARTPGFGGTVGPATTAGGRRSKSKQAAKQSIGAGAGGAIAAGPAAGAVAGGQAPALSAKEAKALKKQQAKEEAKRLKEEKKRLKQEEKERKKAAKKK